MFLLIGQVKGSGCFLHSLWWFMDGLWKTGIWSNEDKESMKIRNPLPHKRSSFIFCKDMKIRFVSWKLPWIQDHEVPDGGHLILCYKGMCEAILRALLLWSWNHAYRPRSSLLFKDEF